MPFLSFKDSNMTSDVVRSGLASVFLVAVSAAPMLSQQGRGIEFGVDAGLFHSTYHVNTSTGSKAASTNVLSFPMSAVRLAVPLSGRLGLEPVASFSYSDKNGQTAINAGAELGLLIELSHDPKETQWFVRPAVGWVHASSSTFATSDRATLGGGIGIRMPLTERIAARYEARYQYLTQSTSSSQNVFGLLAGISVFTR